MVTINQVSKGLLALTCLATVHLLSFVFHVRIYDFAIKTEEEVVPDFIVTYSCDKYRPLAKLQVIDHGQTVSVNYGGLGRRRGLKIFTCLDGERND